MDIEDINIQQKCNICNLTNNLFSKDTIYKCYFCYQSHTNLGMNYELLENQLQKCCNELGINHTMMIKIRNCLYRFYIYDLNQLRFILPSQLKTIRNLGKVSFNCLMSILDNYFDSSSCDKIPIFNYKSTKLYFPDILNGNYWKEWLELPVYLDKINDGIVYNAMGCVNYTCEKFRNKFLKRDIKIYNDRVTNNLTLQEIADKYNITKQRVSVIISTFNNTEGKLINSLIIYNHIKKLKERQVLQYVIEGISNK